MSGRLPQIVDPGRLAESGAILRGNVALRTMSRLADYLHDTEGEVNVELEFGIDALRIRHVRGRITGVLQLVCQRCLQPLAFPLDIGVALGLANSEAAAGNLPGDYEPLIVDDARLETGRLVEDELILALPVVAAHAAGECGQDPRLAGGTQAPAPESGETRRPFAVLGELLREKRRN